jgi:mannose-6-phosphate isomerase-like protein (cupin superfamily)
MDNNLVIDSVKKAVSQKKSILIKNILAEQDLLTWQEAIDEINVYSSIESDRRLWAPKQRGKVDIYDDFKFLHTLPYTNNDKIKKMGEIALAANNTEIRSYSTIISLTEQEVDTSVHSDDVHGFNFQAIGTSLWTVHYENGIEQFEANPGDLVFTPYGVTHEVKSLSPRVSIVIFTKRSETLDAFRSISNNMGKDTQRYV